MQSVLTRDESQTQHSEEQQKSGFLQNQFLGII